MNLLLMEMIKSWLTKDKKFRAFLPGGNSVCFLDSDDKYRKRVASGTRGNATLYTVKLTITLLLLFWLCSS
jgi:hypothetical protein